MSYNTYRVKDDSIPTFQHGILPEAPSAHVRIFTPNCSQEGQ
jgi:hypothetical protein